MSDKKPLSPEALRLEILLAGAAFLFGLAESWACYLLYAEKMQGLVFLLLHLSLVFVLLLLYPFLAKCFTHSTRNLSFSVTFFALAGPLGVLGYFIFLLTVFLVTLVYKTPEDWYEELFPDRVLSASSLIYENIVTGREQPRDQKQVVAFNDVLSFGSHQEKQAVIAVIMENYRPHFAPILLHARQNPSPSLRVQAATAITNIENKYLRDALALKKKTEESPNDPKALLAYANHLDTYAYCGLLDQQATHNIQLQALDAFYALHKLDPSNPFGLLKTVRLLIRLKRFQEALEWINKTPAASKTAAAAALEAWRIECLYELGRFAEVRKEASAAFQAMEVKSSTFASSLKFWNAEAS